MCERIYKILENIRNLGTLDLIRTKNLSCVAGLVQYSIPAARANTLALYFYSDVMGNVPNLLGLGYTFVTVIFQ